MNNMTISKRIWLGFGSILTIILILGFFSERGVNGIVADATEVIDGNRLDRNLAQKEIDHLNWVAKVNALLYDDAITELTVQTDDHKCGFGKWLYGEGRKSAEAFVPELALYLKAIEEPHKKLHQSAVKIKVAEEKSQGSREAKEIYLNESIPALRDVQEKLHTIRTIAKDKIIGEDQMLAAAQQAQFLTRILAILALLIGLPMAFFTARGIVKILVTISTEMSASSDEVSAAATQIDSASHTVSEGASRQAAALEESSASLEEMSSMTRQNAENASQADNLMQDASSVIKDAEGSMEKLTQSMREISVASSETQKIVKTIDEIAFQTNLLALNAAVEAARAGEAGAGFAVVADEVRNLAMRAAEAAKNTSVLIEGTVEKVTTGASLLTESSNSFNAASKATTKIGTLVSEIAAASQEQETGISQVNAAVTDIDNVTQENAAHAEETAAASTDLKSQASKMIHSVNKLITLIGGKTTPSSTTARAPKRPPVTPPSARVTTRPAPRTQKNLPAKATVSPKASVDFSDSIDDDDFEDF